MHAALRLTASTCILLAVALAAAPGCRRPTKTAADREVYGLLGKRRLRVPQVAGTLDIEAKERLAEAARRKETARLTLRDALALATVASREYRSEREEVYLAALALTGQLNTFRPLGSAGGSTGLDVSEESITGNASGNLSISRALETGGSVVFAVATEFLRNIGGDPLRAAQSILSLDFVLPMARGSGRLIALEDLRQAERDTLDALRTYARFQQEFTVDIATRFYRALQLRDNWKNAESAYESLGELVAEQTEKAAAGRLPEFEVDQARQRLLEADDSRQRARNRFDSAVDQFKLDLGIPVSAAVELDDTDLEHLRRLGPQPPPYDETEGGRLAQEDRLDLRNGRAQEKDARRRILIARDALGIQVDLRLGADLSTPETQPFNLSRATPRGSVGLDLDLPFERTTERNAYRRAILQAARARRARQRLEDLVALQVRDAFRNLAEAARSYEIQLEGARLADRRVESTAMLLELGTASIRDRLEAEDARVRARDAATAALVDHALARLAVERDVGTLRVDAEGMWSEPAQPAEPPTETTAVAVPAGSAADPATASADLPPPAAAPGDSATVGAR